MWTVTILCWVFKDGFTGNVISELKHAGNRGARNGHLRGTRILGRLTAGAKTLRWQHVSNDWNWGLKRRVEGVEDNVHRQGRQIVYSLMGH